MHPDPTVARADHLRTLVDALLDSATRAGADEADSAEIAALLIRGIAQAAAADDTMKTAARLTGPTVAILKTSAVGMTESLHTSILATLDNVRFPQLLPGEPANTVLDEIAAERRRQDAKYGGPGNDDAHAHGALVIAGAVYALDAVQGYYSPDVTEIELSSDMLRKHSPCGHNQADDARRRLVKAAALLVAEIERLDRAEPTGATPTDA